MPEETPVIARAGDAAHPRPAQPTLKDIAFMTGLGVATVSRALRDAPDIGQATKDRVRYVARQIGYTPNRAGVRLRTGKTDVIALLLNHEEEIVDLMPKMMFGVAEVLAETQYQLIVVPYLRHANPLDAVCRVVETGSADGIILSRIQPEDPRVRYLSERGFPFATHGRTDMGIVHPYHDFDNEAFAGMAVDWLAGRGRTRLALLGPSPQFTFERHTTTGFVEAIQRVGATEVPFHATIDTPYADIAEAAARLMRSSAPPDGFVCSGAGAALAAATGMEQAGCTVGEQVDIVTKQSFGFRLRPAMLVIYEDHRAAGGILARALIASIDGAPPAKLQSLGSPRLLDEKLAPRAERTANRRPA